MVQKMCREEHQQTLLLGILAKNGSKALDIGNTHVYGCNYQHQLFLKQTQNLKFQKLLTDALAYQPWKDEKQTKFTSVRFELRTSIRQNILSKALIVFSFQSFSSIEFGGGASLIPVHAWYLSYQSSKDGRQKLVTVELSTIILNNNPFSYWQKT